MNFFTENKDKEKDKQDKRPRVPEDLFEEVQEGNEDRPFHENLEEKLGVTKDEDEGGLL